MTGNADRRLRLVLPSSPEEHDGSGEERRVRHHEDGLGLNDKIVVLATDVDDGGTPSAYSFGVEVSPTAVEAVGGVYFQAGPRGEPGSLTGITNEALLAVVADRLLTWQAGPYACEENDRALKHVLGAIEAHQSRARARAARGVLGTREV